jgi:hypothetical protein
MKYFLLILLALATYSANSEELYSPENVIKMQLQFYNSNYKQLLEQNRISETDIPARLIVNDTLILDSVGVRYKGNSSYNIQGDKKSFNISIDGYREDQRLMGYKTLNLNNGFVDPTFMRENIVHKIYSKYIPAMKTGFVYLYINGEEYGLYSNVQQLNKDFLGEWYDYKSGNLYKGDPRGELSWKGADASLYKSDYEKKTNEEADDWTDLVALINAINNSSNLETELPKVLNTDRALWYFALSNIFVNLDSYIFSSHNYYIYNNPSSSLFDFLPWDLNESFGTFPPNLQIKKEEYPTIDLKSPNKTPLLKNMLGKDSFKQKYYAHYRTILNEDFTLDTINAIINSIKPIIDSYVQKDPKKLYTYQNYLTNINSDVNVGGRTVAGITSFVTKRRAYLLNQPDFQKTAPNIKEVKCITDKLFSGSSAVFNVTMKSTATKEVKLYYRIGKGNFQSVQMFDDGNHNDGKGFDNTFGVSINIPQNIKSNNIDFYATAVNYDDVMKFYPEHAEFVYLTKEITQIGELQDVVINEFMASNKTTIKDEAGGYADWIELYNRSGNTISLNKWFLTDDITKKTKWQFPNVSLPAKSYLIIWADEDKEQGQLHANFKLSSTGEFIGLYKSDTSLVDNINFPAQTADTSYGRYPNGEGNFVYMSIPTPGKENTLGIIEIADTLPPVPVCKMDCCGNINLDKEFNLWDMPLDSTRTNIGSITWYGDVSYNYQLSFSSFVQCEDTLVSWNLRTIDCSQDAFAVIIFTDCAGNDTTLFISYIAPDVHFFPDSSGFLVTNPVTVYENQIVLRNLSDKSEPLITDVKLKSNREELTILDSDAHKINLPFTLRQSDSIVFIVQFRMINTENPQDYSDTLQIVDSCSNVIAEAILRVGFDLTSVESNNYENKMLLLPNPASDELKVLSDELIEEISLFDFLGYRKRIKLNEDHQNNYITIDVSDMSNGLYYLQIKNKNRIFTKQLLIYR